ncbi:CpaD family pilus assembly protein [Halomonas sp. LR3S48]|uniref:CpaD family pilus assembly protein n=1 Tax=Halomonas sp. LR3S48 TaxID=2982694 RepID=UPI0021E3945B|nr:CpaD family pilus assembly protein [Halomonas sp. LR3S48]UYG04678.1 CpaD family pilus assembly protein [Halomonas sp. LR3S48]
MRYHTGWRTWRLLPLALLLSGCVSSMGPISWETGYRQVSEPAGSDTEALRRSIAPNTCRVSPGQAGIVPLPPGCANDLNLQAMVERPGDLLHGREMGPARGAPVAAAARERLEDRERANSRRVVLESEARGSASRSATTGDL